MTGKGSVLYADLSEAMTLRGFHFLMRNCLGVERWRVEENVYKVDSMGQVSSTIELHDVSMNSEAFFLQYLIKSPTGIVAAKSSLMRVGSNAFNFTEVAANGEDTNNVIAIIKRQGTWTGTGWTDCMASSSPRGWDISFPGGSTTSQAQTVQDITVAIAGAVTLMGYRDEFRGKDGLDTQGESRTIILFLTAAALVCVGCLFLANFCMVFRASGIKAKVQKTLFDTEGAFLPKHPGQARAPPLYPTY